MKRAPWLLLGATELVLLVLAWGFFRHNLLVGHDLVGHRAAAQLTHDQLFPSFFGWNPWFWCGTPQNQLYPPLLAWSAAGLGHLLGVSLALKLLVALAVLATPPALYGLARAHGLTPAGAALAVALGMAFLALDREDVGGSLRSTFELGNLANAVALPLWLAYAALLPRLRARPLATTALLGLLLLTHLVAGLTALALLLVDRVVAVARKEPEALRNGLLHAAGALALCAFFCVPLLLRLRYGSPDTVGANEYPDGIGAAAVSYAVLVAWFAARRPERLRLAALAGLAGLLLITRELLFNDSQPAWLQLHLHRLKLYDRLILALIAAWLLDGRAARWALAAGAVAFGVFVFASAGIDARGPGPQVLPRLPPVEGRVLVVSSPQSQVSDHALQQLVPLELHVAAGKSIFIQQAANARALIDLEQAIATRPVRAWHIRLDPKIEALRPHAAERLRQLGFAAVLSNEPLALELPSEALDHDFRLYRLGPSAPAEIPGAMVSVSSGEYEAAVLRWLFEGGPIPVENAVSVEAAPTANVEVLGPYTFRVVADVPAPLLIKTTFFPSWHAYDEAGRRLPIHRAGPHFMMTWARGRVSLRYEPEPIDRALGAISLGAWGALAGWAVAGRRRKLGLLLSAALAVLAAIAGAYASFSGRPPMV